MRFVDEEKEETFQTKRWKGFNEENGVIGRRKKENQMKENGDKEMGSR